ncbi:acyltransferase [Hyphomonas sp.]|uniref:acyltransferase family protein n=1 Tax=Hyphomonas sp. TaxID=87 RepID=UPI00324258D2
MLHSINTIRTLSCISIAIFHITEFVNASSDTVTLPFTAAPGFHLFLLISGFTLVYITNPNDQPVPFMMKRAVRILPLYWLMTAVAILMVAFKPWLLPKAELSLEHIVQSFLLLPYYDLRDRLHPILYVGWTLGYIMLFYLMFAISLMAKAKHQIPLTIAMTVGLIVAAQWFPTPAFREFYGDPILLEFASGCIIGLALRQPAVIAFIKRTPMWPFALIGAAGLCVAAWLHYDGWAKIATFAPPAALLVFAAAGQDIFRTPLNNAVFRLGGQISYGIYLIHPIILPVLAVMIFEHIDNGLLGAALIFATVLPISIGLAYLSFRYFETPSNKWLRRVLGLTNTPSRKPRSQSYAGSVRGKVA